MHSNQQLAALREHFCAKLVPSNYKEFDPEFFSCTTTRYLLGRHLEIFGALGILLDKNFPSLGIRNALRSVESLIQV